MYKINYNKVAAVRNHSDNMPPSFLELTAQNAFFKIAKCINSRLESGFTGSLNCNGIIKYSYWYSVSASTQM